jgi:hypothetical protein
MRRRSVASRSGCVASASWRSTETRTSCPSDEYDAADSTEAIAYAETVERSRARPRARRLPTNGGGCWRDAPRRPAVRRRGSRREWRCWSPCSERPSPWQMLALLPRQPAPPPDHEETAIGASAPLVPARVEHPIRMRHRTMALVAGAFRLGLGVVPHASGYRPGSLVAQAARQRAMATLVCV